MAMKSGKKNISPENSKPQASPHMGNYNLKHYLSVQKNLKSLIYFKSQGVEGALGN